MGEGRDGNALFTISDGVWSEGSLASLRYAPSISPSSIGSTPEGTLANQKDRRRQHTNITMIKIKNPPSCG